MLNKPCDMANDKNVRDIVGIMKELDESEFLDVFVSLGKTVNLTTVDEVTNWLNDLLHTIESKYNYQEVIENGKE